MEKTEFLQKYSRDIQIVSLKNENIRELPNYWVEALNKVSSNERKNRIIEEWKKYPYQFQSTTNYLFVNLIDVELVKEKDKYALLYSVKNIKGDEVYYIGYNPLTKTAPQYFSQLPSSFKDIYNNLHNGWVYFASKANGLLPIEDTIILGNEDWGILEEIDVNELPFKLDNTVGLFDNGMGDYASIDLNSKNEKEGLIWWHTKAPKLNIEIWAVIDEWTKMGIER